MATMATRVASGSSARSHWRDSILAGLANYIDGGSIVAGSAALALWASSYALSPGLIGIISAFSANAISAGIGALVGGRLCDTLGRKKIYQFDMLFYAFGMCWLVFATAPWMIVTGMVLVGLAVGADIPASWSLLAELAPARERGRHSGVGQLLWCLGPLVVLTLSTVLAPLGLLGMRIIFAHLALLAIVLTVLRSRMSESAIWIEARAAQRDGAVRFATTYAAPRLRDLLTARNLRPIGFLIGMYGAWNLWAGTNGFFFPYLLRTVGKQTQVVSVALQTFSFLLSVLSILFIFMRLVDRSDQRRMFLLSTALQLAGVALLVMFPLTVPVAIGYLSLVSIGAGFGAQSFFQLWSAELFPTLLRGTAQGVIFAVVRIALGLWSFFVPVLAQTGFRTLALILIGFLVISGVIGYVGAPRNAGKSLAEIESELCETGARPERVRHQTGRHDLIGSQRHN